MIKDKSSDLNKGIARSISDPILISDRRNNIKPKKMNWQLLLFEIKQKRTLFLLLFFLTNLIIMNLCNVFAFKYMTPGPPLPDLIASHFPNLSALRKNRIISALHITTIPSIIFILCSIYVTYYAFNIANIRKVTFLLSIAILFRTIFFMVTQVPPPCSGSDSCYCETVKYETLTKNTSIFKITMIYLFSFSLGTKNVPQCGDLMISGYTVFQSSLFYYSIDLFNHLYSGTNLLIIKIVLILLLLISSLGTILLRSQYTIGVVLAFFFFSFIWIMYSLMQSMYYIAYGRFLTTNIGFLFSLLEEEHIPPKELSADESTL